MRYKQDRVELMDCDATSFPFDSQDSLLGFGAWEIFRHLRSRNYDS